MCVCSPKMAGHSARAAPKTIGRQYTVKDTVRVESLAYNASLVYGLVAVAAWVS